VETYSFTYDVQTTPTAAGGATVHDWGASGYTFVASNDDGQYTFTLIAALTSNETGSQTQTTTAADGSTNTATTTWQSSAQYDRTIDDTTAASGAATGDDSGGGVGTTSSTTTGAYSNPISVGAVGGIGTVSGAQGSSSGQGTSYQFVTQESRDAYGLVTQSGTRNDGNGGYGGDWYSGSASYTVPAPSSSGATTPDISAVADVTAVPSTSGGPYASGATVTGGGTYTESGADSSSSGYSDQYTLGNDGSWLAQNGMGGSSGNGYTQSSYTGSGGYGYVIAGGMVGGTWQENGGAQTHYATATDSTLGGSGVWTNTGTYVSGDGGAQHDSYQGGGAYAINSAVPSASASASGAASVSSTGMVGMGGNATNAAPTAPAAVSASPIPSASGGPGAPGAAYVGTGTVTESALDDSHFGDTNTSTLASDGSWRQAGGEGWTNSDGNTKWAYVAADAYDYPIAGGDVAGTWRQSGGANTDHNAATNYTQSGSSAPAYTGSQTNDETGGQHLSYSGSGNYVVSAGDPYGMGGVSGAALSGSGNVAESGADDSTYQYVTHVGMGSDGSWQPATGGGGMTQTDSTHWHYVVSGGYTRPLDGGALAGTWQDAGGSDTSDNAPMTSTLNPDGTWTTIGTANSSGAGSGAWSYLGAGVFNQSTGTGDSNNGADSSMHTNASENYSQGWLSQYVVVSTLAANGSVSTVTTASASGSASGSHSYTSNETADSRSQTGDYAAGNGSITQSSASSGLSVTESLQSLWQEAYTITSLPGLATTTTGGASGSSQASGDASSYSNTSNLSESASNSSGYSYSMGMSQSTGQTAQDHYHDQTIWSELYYAVAAWASGGILGSMPGATTVDHVWGNATYQGGSVAGSGLGSGMSGSGSGLTVSSGSSTSGGSSSASYDQDIFTLGFSIMGYGAYYCVGSRFDGGWSWGQNWAGAGTNGPLGASAFSGVGYAYTPGNPVTVAAVADQSNTEGDSVSLQIQASDWISSAATGSDGTGYSAPGLPNGLNINPATGLISGTLQAGDATAGPYYVKVSYTDGAGHSASQSFVWDVADPVTFNALGDQSGAEGAAVSLRVEARASARKKHVNLAVFRVVLVCQLAPSLA
jgi:Putative Ig domain